MGFRNPFRIQVDENDVAYVSDYSPDANQPIRGRGPAGTGRYEIVRRPSNYGWPACYSTKVGHFAANHTEWGPNVPLTPAPNANNTAGIPLHDPPQLLMDCASAAPTNDSRWNLEGGPSVEIGRRELPPVTDPDIWYSYQDNAATPLGTPCQAYTQLTVGPPAPGSSTECPRLFPELQTGQVGPHGIAKYNYDPANPRSTKFPPYYDDSVIIAEFTRNWLREVKLDDQNRVHKINSLLSCGEFPQPVGSFECDSPMDLQFGADGSLYLLTYGDSFFAANPDAGMYRLGLREGPAGAAGRAVDEPHRRAGAADRQLLERGSGDADPGDSIRFEWDFGDGSPISTEANPSHTYTQRGRYTARLTVFDSSGMQHSASTVITAGNSSPTITIQHPVRGGTFAFGDKIPFAVTVTDPENAVDCNDVQVTFVLGHDEHGHAEESETGCSGSLQTLAEDIAHGGNVFGVINVRYTDKGGPGGVPALTTIAEVRVNQRKQQVEHVLSQQGTNTASNTDEGGGMHRGSLAPGDWIRLNGPFNLVNINSITLRVADTANGRTAGSPLAAAELRTGSATGDLVTTLNLTSTGGTGDLGEPDVPALAVRAERAVPRLPLGDGRPDRQQPVQPQLRRVQWAGGERRPVPAAG